MNRNSFIKNCILGLCSTLLPEILRPMEGVVKEKFDGKEHKWYLSDEYGQMSPPDWAAYYSCIRADGTFEYFEIKK